MPHMLAAALLHPAQQIGWTNWTIHPSVVVGLAAFGGLYLWRARRGGAEPGPAPAETEGGSLTAAQRLMFFTGLLVMFGSLNGPLHDLSDYYLFSGHMVQHLLLTLVVAPLFVAGTPGWMLRPLLDVRGVGSALRWVTKPTRCFALFNVVLAAWHIPALYNTALAHTRCTSSSTCRSSPCRC